MIQTFLGGDRDQNNAVLALHRAIRELGKGGKCNWGRIGDDLDYAHAHAKGKVRTMVGGACKIADKIMDDYMHGRCTCRKYICDCMEVRDARARREVERIVNMAISEAGRL